MKDEVMDTSAETGQRAHTLLLLTSPDIRWEGLQRLVEREPLVHIVGDVAPHEILIAMARLQPDGVLIGAELGVDTVLSSARIIRDHRPGTRLLVFGDQADYELEMELARLGASSYLLWENVNIVSLSWTLGAVLEAGLHVVSPRAVEEIAFHERRAYPREEGLVFSDRERVVLAGLAAGLSERRIAEGQQLGPRTVERTVARLIEKLQARDLHELRRRAHDLGCGAGS
jgi:DNA-binding NarL/FixJ family response regulator